jgi:hypothetical protein
MRNPFRKKPAPVEVIVLVDNPCPTCGLADYLNVKQIDGRDVLGCVNCKTEWFADVLLKNGYTSGKG